MKETEKRERVSTELRRVGDLYIYPLNTIMLLSFFMYVSEFTDVCVHLVPVSSGREKK